MKKAKLIRQVKKDNKKVEKDEYSIKKMLIIVIIVALIFVLFYGITMLVVKNKNKDSNDNSSENVETLDIQKIVMSSLLTMGDAEYYVLATKESLYNDTVAHINYSELYGRYIKDYSEQEGSLKFYKVDLDDAMNKSYLSEDINISNDLSELRLNDEALFKINNGTIERHFVGRAEIIDELSSLVRTEEES